MTDRDIEEAGSAARDANEKMPAASDLENTIEFLEKPYATNMPLDISIRLERIERELERIEKSTYRKISHRKRLNEQQEPAASEQTGLDRDTLLRMLGKIYKNMLDNAYSIEKLNKTIWELQNARNVESMKYRILSNIEIEYGRAAVSMREREIMIQLLEGKTNREISQTLGISEKTVKNHLWRLYRKLGVENRTQLFHQLISM
jgi:DNA-binding CsgD family transcriptional regulator